MYPYGYRRGERFRGAKVRYRRGSWVVLPLMALAWFAPAVSAESTNLLVNGTFDGSSGWTVVENGGSGLSFSGALVFSYATGTVSQTVAASPGQTIDVSFTVDNSQTNSIGWSSAVPDIWTATLSSGETSAEVGRSVAHGLETFNLSITVPQGASSVTLTLSGRDMGFWAGNYGPTVDNVVLTATTTGLSVRGYNISQNPPLRVDSQTPNCSATYANIYDWPSVYMAGCRSDQVMLHYTGSIVVPATSARFRIYSDDGAWVSIGSNEFGRWGLRGCSYTESPEYQFNQGESLPIDAWFYEWGGGECFRLYWDIGNGWEVVPASAFTSASTPPPTTTTTTTTTTLPPLPDNVLWYEGNENETQTFTAPEGYVFSSVLFASYGTPEGSQGRYTVGQCDSALSVSVVSSLIGQSSGTISFNNSVFGDPCGGVYKRYRVVLEVAPAPPTTTTTTTTTTTEPPTTTTTTEVPTTWEESTTTSTTSSSVPTPSVDAPTTTVPATTTVAPTTTQPPATVPVTRTTSTTSTSTTTDAPAPTTTSPQTTVPDTTTTQPTTTTTLPSGGVTALTPSDISSLSPESLVSLLEDTPITALGKEQLLAVVENAPLDDLPDDQLTEIFAAIDPTALTPEETAQLIGALNEADDDTKSLFEDEVNVFSSGLDTYVPSGSNVPVSTRRVIIAATTVVSTLTVASPPSSPSPASPSTDGGGGPGSGGPSGSGAPDGSSGAESEPRTKRRRLFGGR